MNIRENLLQMFKQAGGEFISGEEISRRLGVSRTAIWKHIEEFREEGYVFEAVRRSGYRLVFAPDVMIAEEIKVGLSTRVLGQKIYYYPSIDSTQNKCQELAKEGAPEGTLVVADQQTEGKGRLGRVWHSPPGANISMSLLLRPALELQKCPQLTLLTAVAVVETLHEFCGISAQIKWPNDILINGKKVCGILTELNAESDRIHSLIVGIGLNVNTLPEHFPEDVHGIATSLRIEKGEPLRRVPLLQQILTRLEELYDLYLAKGFAPVKKRWETYAVTIGKKVTIRTLQGSLSGYAEGIDESGVLLVRREDGSVTKVYSADVEIHG
ncbi:biotin--[acetyl-CoA-carboxylase] ligase [Aneurinibacillus thermoaerophilus]|jgi:BirA family biotin operon repressor/biotin-[acetyl-CoA-carboxylase] ligase|uniref:Bifunctional ligase/repressor BirA n=1 Tax=Aneurinibacillus thermoaerophilus TaxID=143495 RepID=A0A1G8BTX8_ANETH|nr:MULTISPECIES: biotin--[acetyl-CoA-carboxylase] ligase [Aneurinibacillus]AMA73542.1 biotin--acetyl-CoA-carboxylase ligase [Aneurinibacillus sp. XH2]MED0674929.1 biotin--[acetyl-CoA-carboxylase] ligase [Aneurinibacillus thermoaerophilus]MED0756181.1 biotin--[acetyl-CoA-carboxylase] ligase [Aneurinibacillus thermoaerophilus]MED0760384.1 biotin--[acetyl-CoA-carboxylase] ligase [Aneurinibacillus thermoaerophilus]QYY43887.1 biotin--[acetyl-CoA-carboxylase] ligase [Aneurinibacillus thermoaerophilu